ncbi:hypothetical protein SAMN04487941_3061 [Pontibacter akesuensis]|uniref:Uncharacterized protein n=1 Tax=Pontibacter akesuensis TaxID=388950 RepID=A0A1I7JND2_9BACT|nr:hypothetical protein SAMN04487941_3061 [Pontibacter akesuensis]
MMIVLIIAIAKTDYHRLVFEKELLLKCLEAVVEKVLFLWIRPFYLFLLKGKS